MFVFCKILACFVFLKQPVLKFILLPYYQPIKPLAKICERKFWQQSVQCCIMATTNRIGSKKKKWPMAVYDITGKGQKCFFSFYPRKNKFFFEVIWIINQNSPLSIPDL